MASVNFGLIVPANGLIDWNTPEDYESALKAIEEWKRQTNLELPIVTWVKKEGTLEDWL